MAVTAPRAEVERRLALTDRALPASLTVFFVTAATLPWPGSLVGTVGAAAALCAQAHPRTRRTTRPAVVFATAAVGMLLATLVPLVLHPVGAHGVRLIAQFAVLAVIAVVFCLAPRSDRLLGSVWLGVTTGAVLAALVALVAVTAFGVPRAAGIGAQAIAFGDLALLMGALSVALARFADRAPLPLPPRMAAVAPAVGAMSGALASALSGARGGWLAAPVMVVVLVAQRRRAGRGRLTQVAVLAGAAAVAAVVFGGGMPIERLADARENVVQYLRADDDPEATATTIGARFEAWRSAGDAFTSSPLLGVGWGNLQEHFRDDVVRGDRDPRIEEFVHAHQQLLGALASGGVLSGAAMVALLAAPAHQFRRAWRSADERDQAIGAAGLLVVAGFAVFGLTEGIMENLAPVTFYGVVVGALSSQIAAGRRPDDRRQAAGRRVPMAVVAGRDAVGRRD